MEWARLKPAGYDTDGRPYYSDAPNAECIRDPYVASNGDVWVVDGREIKRFSASLGGALAMYLQVPGLQNYGVAPDGSVVVSYRSSDWFAPSSVAKHDPSGKRVWSRSYTEVLDFFREDPSVQDLEVAAGLVEVADIAGDGSILCVFSVSPKQRPPDVPRSPHAQFAGVVLDMDGQLVRTTRARGIDSHGRFFHRIVEHGEPLKSRLVFYDSADNLLAEWRVAPELASWMLPEEARQGTASLRPLGAGNVVFTWPGKREVPFFSVFSEGLHISSTDWVFTIFTKEGRFLEQWRFPFTPFVDTPGALIGADGRIYRFEYDDTGVDLLCYGPIGSLAAAVRARAGEPREAVFQLTNDFPLPR
jgi:hypothetical protein